MFFPCQNHPLDLFSGCSAGLSQVLNLAGLVVGDRPVLYVLAGFLCPKHRALCGLVEAFLRTTGDGRFLLLSGLAGVFMGD